MLPSVGHKESQMPQFELKNEGCTWFDSRDEFVQSYIMAAFWTEEFDDVDVGGLTETSRLRICDDCARFCKVAKTELDEARHRGVSMGQLGHDFWLTRNGHGTGFWDRSILAADQLGDKLSTISEVFGEASIEADVEGVHYYSSSKCCS